MYVNDTKAVSMLWVEVPNFSEKLHKVKYFFKRELTMLNIKQNEEFFDE